jgi:hypothetical protein
MRISIVLSLWLGLAAASIGDDPSSSRPSTPAEDLKALQGRWQVASIFWPNTGRERLPEEARLGESGISLAIESNQMTHDGKLVAALANDLPLAAQEKEVGFAGNRLLMLTLPSGRGLLCSYRVLEEKIMITYPHTASCHRGSGQIVYLTRPAK